MSHRLTAQQYLMLVAVALTAAIGDTLLSHGMQQVGPVDLHHLSLLLAALTNLWVVAGILFLIGFFASYLTALSWADLTFVLPSTASSYVVVALLSHFWLHEHVSLSRWAGILLIVGGVGFVSQGPALTEHTAAPAFAEAEANAEPLLPVSLSNPHASAVAETRKA